MDAAVIRIREAGPGDEPAIVRLSCVVVSVAAMPANEGALRFYRARGLVDEAVLLEKPF